MIRSALLRIGLSMALLAAVAASSHAVLIGHWTFDEGTGLVAGNSANASFPGTISGLGPDPNTPEDQWVTGRVGSFALSFNGSDDQVIVNGSESSIYDLVDSSFTFAWWLNHPGTPGQCSSDFACRMINKDDGQDSSGGYSFSRPDRFWYTHFSGAGGSNNGNVVGANEQPVGAPANQWSHVAYVYDSTINRTQVFMGGIAQGTVNNLGTLASDGDDPLVFGRIPCCGQHFKGVLDDIRIYDAALSGQEIATLAEVFSGTLGDFNNDANIDSNDYVILRSNFRTGTLPNEGDMDFDADIDLDDFFQFAGVFEANNPGVKLPTIPEPSALMLIGTATLLVSCSRHWLTRRGKRRKS